MIKIIRNNTLIRKMMFNLLKNKFATKEHFIDGKKQYYNKGRSLGHLFKKRVVIEPQITENFIKLLKPDFTVFDIGANIGYYTILFSDCVKNGKVIAVEPDSYSIPIVEKNIQINGLQNVTLVKKAISDKEGESSFILDLSTGQTSSLLNDVFHPNGAILKETKLLTTTLDLLSEKYGYPDFIKCDVEGAELLVFSCAQKTLKNKPILMIEVKDNNAESIYNILAPFGYKIYNAEKSIENQTPLNGITVPNIIAY